MQRIADAVNHGFTHHISGTVSIDRLPHLVAKFDLNFQVFADRNVRARRKQEKLGNVQIVLWHNNGIVHWWLLATAPEEGEHHIHKAEKLRNALDRTGRFEIDGFELVRLPYKENKNIPKKENKNIPEKAKPKADSKKATCLTWRMSEQKYQDWRLSIIDTVRSRSTNNMHHLLYRLYSSPGFSGIRSQIGKLAALYLAEVKRAAIKEAPKPPKRLGYVRRLKHSGITLLQLVAQAKSGTQ